MSAGGLHFRRPQRRWMLIALAAALCLHGFEWFLQASLLPLEDGGAFAVTQRQVVLALFWMGGALALWNLAPPPSRLHAVMMALLCVLFVSVMGSVFVVAGHALRGAAMEADLLSSFAIYGGLLVLAQLVLAVPTAVLLQGLALSRRT